MKIIDKTPFFNEKGEISTTDRLKAFLQYGKSWLTEMEAQRSVLAVLDGVLDRRYTLLRNIKPPDIDAPIPFILLGPPGIFVMYVTPIMGMFRARGDQWGTIRGNNFIPEKVNLLTRTERMARAVQVYLQRQGFSELITVEAILLCSDPAVHVDSLRPIIRVIMRDGLERFAVSLTQARVVLNPEMVFNLVTLLTEPPAPKEEVPAPESSGQEQQAAMTPEDAASAAGIPAYLPEAEPVAGEQAAPAVPSIPQQRSLPSSAPVLKPAPRRRGGITRRQWLFLGFMALIWLLLMAVFIFIVIRDLNL